MKILIVTSLYPPHSFGGYELRCKDVMDGLRKKGHELLVIAARCPTKKCDIHDGEKMVLRVLHLKIDVDSLISQMINDFKDIKFIAKTVREFDPETVYLWHIVDLSNAILPYFSHQKIPLVYDEGGSGLVYFARIIKKGLYGNEKDLIIKKLLKNGIYWIANLVSNNLIKSHWSWPQNMRVYFNSYSSLQNSKSLGVPVEGARVIHSGIEITKFPYVERDHIRLPVKILIPGRIKPQKGTMDIIFLAKELMKRTIPVRIRLVGEIQSQTYFNEIIEALNENGLNDVVEYLSMVTRNQLAHFYQNYDFCFFPSYQKSGFSRVPLEAMASGCLVITYGNEGSGEIIKHQETGLLVSEGDVLKAADLIEGLMEDNDQYKNITQNARLQIENEHSLDRYLDSIDMYLHENLDKSTMQLKPGA